MVLFLAYTNTETPKMLNNFVITSTINFSDQSGDEEMNDVRGLCV